MLNYRNLFQTTEPLDYRMVTCDLEAQLDGTCEISTFFDVIGGNK